MSKARINVENLRDVTDAVDSIAGFGDVANPGGAPTTAIPNTVGITQTDYDVLVSLSTDVPDCLYVITGP